MKIFRSVFIVSLFFFAVIPACIKNTVTVDYVGTHNPPPIVIPKPIVKRGEPFTVSTSPTDPNTIIKWAIRPSDNTAIIPYESEAFITITLAGTYVITADFYTSVDTVHAFDSS